MTVLLLFYMKFKMENFCLENAFQLSFSVNFISKVFDFWKNKFEVLFSIYFKFTFRADGLGFKIYFTNLVKKLIKI